MTLIRLAILAVGLIGAMPSAYAVDARAIYTDRCSFCHGTSGHGDGPAGAALKPPPRDLTTAEYWKSANSAVIKDVITNGKPGTAMVAFKNTLSPDEISALVEFVQGFNPAK